MRTLFSLAIAGVVVHGAFRAGSAYFVYFEFRDGVQQTAQFGVGRSEQELHARVMTIAGDLGVSPTQGTWIITSYAVANAIAMPLTGWLTTRFGQVRLIVTA